MALPPKPVGWGLRKEVDGEVALELPVGVAENAENGPFDEVAVVDVFWDDSGEKAEEVPKRFIDVEVLVGGGELDFLF